MDLPPRDPDDIAQQPGGQPVTSDTADGLDPTLVGQLDEVAARTCDALGDERPDSASDLFGSIGEPTLELVAGSREASLIVLDEDLEDLGREVVDVTLQLSDSGHIASSRDSGRDFR
jgi:hypothetical protein